MLPARPVVEVGTCDIWNHPAPATSTSVIALHRYIPFHIFSITHVQRELDPTTPFTRSKLQYQADTVHCVKSCRIVFSPALAYTENVWIAAVTVAVATIDWRASPAPGESFVIDRPPSGHTEAPAVITSCTTFFAHVTVKLLL